jgi:hypothetical protein
VNYLVVNGIQIAKCMEEGTTEQECKAIVESFNSNLTMSLMLEDILLGQLYLDTKYNNKTGLYYPTVMIHSDKLGKKDFSVTDILQVLGVELSDILRAAAQISQ